MAGGAADRTLLVEAQRHEYGPRGQHENLGRHQIEVPVIAPTHEPVPEGGGG